ncbi:MAG: hypothetical protein P1U74_07495 [Legionellaceae bacterium]|nr:hypothetical protein [Legionellaceae bacterium]
MKKALIILSLFITNFCFASSTPLNIDSPFELKSTTQSEKTLLMGSVSDINSPISELTLNFFATPDCSDEAMASSVIHDIKKSFSLKSKSIFGLLAEIVYRAGEIQLGVEKMSLVHSISISLKSNEGMNNQVYFPTDGLEKFTNSYCVKNVICANELCKSYESTKPPFTPLVINQSDKKILTKLRADINLEGKMFALNFSDEAVRVIYTYLVEQGMTMDIHSGQDIYNALRGSGIIMSIQESEEIYLALVAAGLIS